MQNQPGLTRLPIEVLDPWGPIVEARKLEQQYPHAHKVEYRGS